MSDVHEHRLAVCKAAGRIGPGEYEQRTRAAIALDELEPALLGALCAAADDIRAEHPLEYVGGMKNREADAWLGRLHELEAAALRSLDVVDEFEHEWVDVLAEDGRWMGRWSSSRGAAVLSNAYWWAGVRMVRAGVGIAPPMAELQAEARDRQREAQRAEREAEAMAGGLLGLLGDW